MGRVCGCQDGVLCEVVVVTCWHPTICISLSRVECNSIAGIGSSNLSLCFVFEGYFVDVSSEAEVIQRVAKYHRAWNQQKEKSGLLQLLFVLFCKARFKLMIVWFKMKNL